MLRAVSVNQTEIFKAAEAFAKVEGILPAPESSHAIKVAIDEAKKCKETGESKNIVFGLTGTGYFDLAAYKQLNDGTLKDHPLSEKELNDGLSTLPDINI